MTTDFPPAEFEARVTNAHKAMHAAGIDALLLTTEAEVRYFTGFRTAFWQSPTRPWFVVLPMGAKPIAIIPEIGAALMRETWVEDIRTWAAPHATDDGLSLLSDALRAARVIGMPMGRESSLRMPLANFEALRARLAGAMFLDASPLLRNLRLVKSAAEIALIADICQITSAAFAQAPSLFHEGQPLNETFRAFKIALLKAGAEDVLYLVGGAGQGGYGDVISPPDDTPLRSGDVLMLDTGASLKGYFADFDRNFAIGQASDAARTAYDTLWSATEAGLQAARPGVPVADVFQAMAAIIGQGASDVGRYGHGLGMQLTEPPSLIDFDETILAPGMVITLEPSLTISPGKIMVHEENIVITDGAPQLLSERAARELPVL